MLDTTYSRVADQLDPTGLQALYFRLIAGRRAWLDYHFSPAGPSPFGVRLLLSLAACEARQAGLGRRLMEELAEIRYVPSEDDEAGWKAGFEQLVQKFAEILVCRLLCDAPWPEGTTIECEPKNPTTGARPEFSVKTPERTWLFEVKCPSFIKHQAGRRSNPAQLPIRSFMREMPALAGKDVTLPRDNVLKDFLTSAEHKFSGFDAGPTTGILVVIWDAHMYEAVSVLAHEEAGLLTEKSWLQKDGARVPFSSVDGVILINRLDELKAAAQEVFNCLAADPFTVAADQWDMPSVWCPNERVGPLDALVAKAFDAWPVDDVGIASDYAKTDFVMWIPSSYGAHLLRLKRRRMNAFKCGVSHLAITTAVWGAAHDAAASLMAA